ncbi:MAG: DUF484 family protein [Desulfarculus sp.]|jgi:uncharacterized protein YigA (DUF484 family)|nr:MAG: DUF484 family protein [Desulfarculus sp.]
MLPTRGLDELVQQARRNEEIQKRLDQVEEFLLATHDLAGLLASLPATVAQMYRLEAVTLALLAEHQPLQEALASLPLMGLPETCLTRPRKELRLLLADLEGPYLTNKVSSQLLQCFFPGLRRLASLAVLPLWVGGQMLGTLNLGSAAPQRYQPALDTHFLERLGRKAAFGLNAALLLDRARRMEQRQVVVEMAGAACHELAQPLSTLMLGLEKLRRSLAPDDPRLQELEGLMDQAERMGDTVKKISQVNDYVTRPYAQGLRIVDLQAASSKEAG